MEDRQALFSRIVRAVQTINNSTSSNVERTQANEFIENVKAQHGPSLMDIAFAFAEARTQSSYLQHIGYHFLEHIIQNHWNSMSLQDKTSMKGIAVRLLQTAPDDLPPIFQEKVAQILAEVAKREWPQQWPEFFDTLTAGMQESDTKAGVVLRAIRTLAEDTMASPFASKPPKSNCGSKWDVVVLSAARRKDILLALRDIQERLLTLLACFMQVKYGVLSAPPSPAAKATAASLINRVQELLTALMEALRTEELFRFNFPLMWIALMAEQEACRMPAAYCLLEFVGQTFALGPHAAAFGTFVGTLCDFTGERMAGVLAAGMPKAHDDAARETHAFHKALAQTLNSLVSANLKAIHQGGLLPRVLGATVAMLHHPSLALSECALDLLARLLQEDALREGGEYVGTLPVVLPLLKTKGTKGVGAPGYTPPLPVTAFAAFDFDGDDEYALCLNGVRGRATQILTTTSRLAPAACVQFVVWVADELLRDWPQPRPSDPRNGSGNVTQRSPTYLQWESAAWVIGAVLDAAFAPGTAGVEDLTAALTPTVRRWLDLAPQDACLVAVYFTVVGALTPFLAAAAAAECLQSVLGKLFSYMAFKGEGEAAVLCEDTRAARRKAHNTFIRLATRMPDLLVPYLDTGIRHSQALMQHGVLLDTEVSLLLEAMTAISNRLPPDQQAAFFEGILTPAVGPWTTDVPSVLQDGPTFLHVCGLSGPGGDGTLHPRLREMQHYLDVFVGVYRRATPPADPTHSLVAIADRLLPPLLLLIAQLHAMYDPAPAALLPSIPAEHRTALALMHDEEVALLGKLATHPPLPPVPPHIAAARKALHHLRVSSYTLLGLLPRFSSLLYAQVAQLRRCVLSPALYHALTQHLRHLIHYAVAPIVLHCPPQYHHVLPLFVPQLHHFLVERLTQRWAALGQRAAADDPIPCDEAAGGAEVTAEVLQEILERQTLRGLAAQTLEVLDHFAAAAAPAPTAATSGDGAADPKAATAAGPAKAARERGAQLAQFLWADESISGSLFMFVAAAVAWPDTPSALKAVRTLAKFLPTLCKDGRFAAPLYAVVGACVQRLLAMSPPPSAAVSPAGATSAAQEALATVYRSSQAEVLIHEAGNLCCDVYCALHQHAPAFPQLWAQLGMPPDRIQELHEALQRPSEKARRLVFRGVVSSLVGRNL